MVRAFHAAGIEVILDVVFNHTGEGDDRGRTYSFRGLDNELYYLLGPDGNYLNFSGCGNTVNCNHPVVRELLMTCLRFWVADMHVDGLRFDLASVLGRDRQGNVLVEPPVVEMIAEDGVLADTKLIAEPWDAGGPVPGGPVPLRPALVGVERPLPRRRPPLLARRAGHGRRPGHAPVRQRRPVRGARAGSRGTRSTSSPATTASRSGTWSPTTTSTTRPTARTTATASDENLSWNCGVEGPTDDPARPRPAPAAGQEPDGDAAAVAGRADAAGRRRVPAHAAGQQQRLVPGQRDQLGRLDAGRDATPTSCASCGR